MSTEFVTTIDLTQVLIQVSSISDSIDRTQYSSMKECLTCQTPLGKTGAKKFFCYFCYRAICAGCSPIEILHPETRKPQKMCHPCYVHYVKLQVLQVGAEFVTFRLKSEIEEKAKLVQEREILETNLEQLKKIREDKNKEFGQETGRKQEELIREQGKYKVFCEEYERVKVEYDKTTQTPGAMPETQHRDTNCMKCEIF